MTQPSYLFVIDTEQYAGNFERELCAWCTGQIGQCGVGDREAADFASLFHEDYEIFTETVAQFDDRESGCLRPVKLVETPGWLNNGLGYQYRDIPSEYPEALARLKKSTFDYDQSQFEMIEKRIAENNFENTLTGWTKENCLRVQKSILSRRDRVDQITEPPRYPAFLSVGIGFYKKPTREQTNLIISRAETYSIKNEITITGFRIISCRKKTSEPVFRTDEKKKKFKQVK